MHGIVATTTWNSIDLIRPFLGHYRRLGFGRVLVMDYDSDDGTRDLLEADEWRDFVTIVPFPGLASLDSSNILLSIAKTDRTAQWCLFCDPDELLRLPDDTRLDDLLSVLPAAAESVVIPRFNMTGPRSRARLEADERSHVEALTLRIIRRYARVGPHDIDMAELEPPWIFTAILPKVLVRVAAALAIGEGDHSARTENNSMWDASDGVRLLHYPVRTFSAFQQKVDLARLGFAANPHLSQAHGWQVRRWINLASAGRLLEEYYRQFIPDEDVGGLIADGTLCLDDSGVEPRPRVVDVDS